MFGRIICGFATSGLSVMASVYEGESGPTHVGGAIVWFYQLFIMNSILWAYLINLETYNLSGFALLRVPVGISFMWALLLGFVLGQRYILISSMEMGMSMLQQKALPYPMVLQIQSDKVTI